MARSDDANGSLTVLVLGSYNGQDSFGDKVLLRCVTMQLRAVIGDEVRFVSHVFDNLADARRVAPDVEFHGGLMPMFRQWQNIFRRVPAPYALQMLFTLTSLPLWLVATRQNRREAAETLRDIRHCSLFYFYGGTQLSQQWFRLNFPSLALVIVAARLLGKPVYFGPQQYGPESSAQSRWLRMLIGWLVRGVRVRNTRCLKLLGLPPSKLLLDEVYSCTARFPLHTSHPRERSFILINLRGRNFLRADTDSEFHAFIELLEALYRMLGLPFKLFQMSGAGFCDDTRLMAMLGASGSAHLPVEVIAPFGTEHELVDLARQAYGTVSMSFHGCVLSMIGGCPAVPITSGEYLDYKYADFDRYTGGQRAPRIALTGSDLECEARLVVEYFERFESELTAMSRERAATDMKEWYRHVATECFGADRLGTVEGGVEAEQTAG